MAYRDRQGRGTYRGVPFATKSSSGEIGRRTSVFEIPGSEVGAGHSDNGIRAWRQTLTIVVVGPDYDYDRNDLIKAFNEAGAGELVHPYYGTKKIVIDGAVRVEESDDNGGMATFTFTAVEVAEQTPTLGIDTAGELIAAIDAANATFLDSFAGGFDAATSSENFVRVSALDKLDTVLADIRKVTGAIGSALDAPSRLSSQIDSLTRELSTLINTPRALLASVVNVLASVKNLISTTKNALGSYGRSAEQSAQIGSAVLPLDAADTPNRRREALNTRQIKDSFKGATLTAMAGVAVDYEFGDAAEAREVRDLLMESMDDLLLEADAASTDLEATLQAEGTLDKPEVFAAIRRVQSALYAHLTAAAGLTSEVASYEPAEALPSVVISQQLYGTADRHTEIESRNVDTIRHPGFIAGSVPIEVLAK